MFLEEENQHMNQQSKQFLSLLLQEKLSPNNLIKAKIKKLKAFCT